MRLQVLEGVVETQRHLSEEPPVVPLPDPSFLADTRWPALLPEPRPPLLPPPLEQSLRWHCQVWCRSAPQLFEEPPPEE